MSGAICSPSVGDAKMKNLLKRLHRDDAGAMSVEKILILALIALPILIILLLFRTKISGWFNDQASTLEQNKN
jgi:Flp pilus assembly pilin Flp